MKRFTETDKWKDTWFRKLEPAEKLLWIYILDNCDNAGFFELDVELCSFITKMEEKRVLGAIKGLNRGLTAAKSPNVYYVNNFLKHQKNINLNPENNAHKQIISLLAEKSILFDCILAPNKGLNSPTGKGKGKGKVKDKEYTPEFEEWWAVYKVGVKANAFIAWKKQAGKPDNLIDLTRKYLAYCKSSERKIRDGQGFLNGRLWESEWTDQAQGTSSSTKIMEIK